MTSTIDWSLDDVTLTKQLLALSKPKLIKTCKSKQVSYIGNKKDLIDRLVHKNKENYQQKAGKSKKKLKKKPSQKKSIKKKSIKKKESNVKHEEKHCPLSISVDLTQEKEIDIKEMENERKEKPKMFHVKVDKLKKHGKKGSYIWILDKKRKLRSIPSPVPISNNSNWPIRRNRKLSLTNSHNFLWITSVLRGTISFATKQSELNKASFDRMLSLFPLHYRKQIWEIVNIDEDTFVVSEDYIAFVDCLLIATGQKYEMEQDMDIEIRDMSNIFNKIVNIDNIFKERKYTTNTVSKSKIALSVVGATKIILNLRNLKENLNESDIDINIQNDLALPILTGLTKKALIHSVTYCTQSYWKILSDIFWDEENEQDLALCTPIAHFNSVMKSTSIQDLFGELYCIMSYDLGQIQEDVQEYVDQKDLDIEKYLTV